MSADRAHVGPPGVRDVIGRGLEGRVDRGRQAGVLVQEHREQVDVGGAGLAESGRRDLALAVPMGA
jgi:hypothetical protein